MLMFLRVFSLILLASLLLTGLLFILRRYLSPGAKALEHINPSAFTFFTSLYAFFLGFAIVTLWSAYLKAEANVVLEADSLMASYRLSRDLPRSDLFRQSMLAYVKSVLDDEWPAMQDGSMSEVTHGRFEEVWEKLSLMKPAAASGDSDIYIQVAGLLSASSHQRVSRGLLMASNLYPPVWVIIVFGLVTILFGLYLFHIQQTVVRLVFDFMVIFMVLSCIYFIYDINTPFSGYIVVKPDIFKQIYVQMLALQ